MKAAVLTRIGGPLEILEVGLTPLTFGQVLVRVIASGICGAQLKEIAGHKNNAKHIPHLLGHEGCGYVEEIGPGVTTVKPGDMVVMHWRVGSGIESDLPCYTLNGRTITSGRVTTFSEMSICSENRLTQIPEYTPPDIAALLGCGLSTALSTVEREADLQFGQSLLIVGVGGLGVNLIKAAKLRHAYPIVAADINEGKKELSLDLGADFFINLDLADPADLLVRLGLTGFDVIIDTAGATTATNQTLRQLAPSGRYILVGQPDPGRSIKILDAVHLFEGNGKTIRATQGGGFTPAVDIPRYLNLHRMGQLETEGIITDRMWLKDINQGIERVREGLAGRILVDTTFIQ